MTSQTRLFTAAQRERVVYWLPAVLAGIVAMVTFAVVGQTPLLRAAAMSVVIVGVSLSLRRLGSLLAFAGGLILAFCPAYWQQTGGPDTISLWVVLAFLGVGGGLALLILRFSRHLFLSVAVGVSAFVGLYVAVGLTQKSLRLTTILSAWLVYMLIIALRQTNPRPEEPAAIPLSRPHTYGVLLMLTLGVLNEPLFTLFAPGVVLGLWLSHVKLPRWYWLVLLGVLLLGSYRLSTDYIAADWLTMSTGNLNRSVVHLPFIMLDGWREPLQWLWLSGFMMQQFTWAGAVLGAIGIARMSRWYPTLGVTLMVIYASYGSFGLMYFGQDIEILLMPMLIIQVICITYAVYTLLQWLSRWLPDALRADRRPWLTNTTLFSMTVIALVWAVG